MSILSLIRHLLFFTWCGLSLWAVISVALLGVYPYPFPENLQGSLALLVEGMHLIFHAIGMMFTFGTLVTLFTYEES